MTQPNEPTTADQEIINLPLDRLNASPTNPRKRKGFDEQSLNELAASMRPPIGIMSPILVRKRDSRYEIVFGERRWRAAKIAGLTTAPCIVRDLTDEEVLQIQLIENKRREDLDELEEAEGYEKLLQQHNAAGEPYTVEMIAQAMGVSKGTIYARMKLLDLCEKGRQAFYDQKIDASTALLIARVSPEKIQLEALQEIIEDDMSYRTAREFIQDNYMLELKSAIFDIQDAALLKKAGTCDGCPKRTGNQPDLFEDVKSKDVCTDPVCFAMKKAAHFLIIRNKAEAEGAKIIKGPEAKKLLPYGASDGYWAKEHLNRAGLARPEDKVPNDPKGRTWGKLLDQQKLLEPKDGAKPKVMPVIIECPDKKDEIIQAINMAEAAKALREQGYEVNLRGTGGGGAPVKTEKEKAEAAKLRAQTKVESIYRARLVQAIHDKAKEDLEGANPQLRPEIFQLLAMEIYDSCKAYARKKQLVELHLGEKVAKKDPWEANEAFRKHLQTLHPQLCMLVMIDLIMAPEETVDQYTARQKPETLLSLATIHAIDAAAIKKEAEQEIKAQTAAKKDKAAAKPAKKAPKKAGKVAEGGAAGKVSKDDPAPHIFGTAKTRPAASWPFPTPGKPKAEPTETKSTEGGE